MIQYILECIAFQLAFLIIYDFFLKRETFFQWNRAYLIGTYLFSLILPWIKIEALKTAVPELYYAYPEFLWNTNNAVVANVALEHKGFEISWQAGVLYGGMLLAACYFGYKLYRLQQLRREGTIARFPNFTRIVVKNSELAFSFFKSIFLGDKVLSREHESIIQHELVHINQRHSLDLVFFELMRIIGWFNPLVYVYQNRIAELHEFIADAQVPKTERKAHYDLLLSQVFQTQNISFVNQFYNKSLIKKRIVMLQKSKSKKIFQLKYLLLVPLVFGMLFYTSCKQNEASLEKRLESLNQEIEKRDSLTSKEKDAIARMTHTMITKTNENTPTINGWKVNVGLNPNANKEETSLVELYNELVNERNRLLQSTDESNPIITNLDYKLKEIQDSIEGSTVPFAVIDEVPVFPSCENAIDKRKCFNEMMQTHISKNFNYPKEAQDAGIQGRVNVMFTIQKDGSIGEIKMRGPDKLLEDEVERIIGKLPMMTPGKQKGKVVAVPFSMPITFKLK